MAVATRSQDKIVQKECRISSGYGFSNSVRNSKGIGSDFWLQLSYDVLDHFSLATEFENMRYNFPGLIKDVAVTPNQFTDYNNNFSLLVKYSFVTKKKWKLALASGWTYCIIQTEYQGPESSSSLQTIVSIVTTYNDYRIPLLAEVSYPVTKNLQVQGRVKWSINVQQGNVYSGGLGLSLKL